MSWGMKVVGVIIIIGLSIIQFPGLQNTYATGDLIDESSLIGHSTIYINNLSSFTSANGVVGGNGTVFNPFIIENWSIDASHNHGIWIENTNEFFIIRNCYIWNGTNESAANYGIYLNNLTNGFVINNRLIFNENGIFINRSIRNIIHNNTCNSNNYCGINLNYSHSNEISNNSCAKNKEGIYILWDSTYNIIVNNFCRYNNNGIFIQGSSLNRINNNTFSSNKVHGIYHRESNKNIIINNTCNSNNNRGIDIEYFSYENIIVNNMIKNNNQTGIYFHYYSKNNIVYNNIFSNKNNYAEYFNCKNIWNISKIPGENIVNGLYLGGNYWSDYFGYDIDGDGLGDSYLPFGPGDYHPLIVISLPVITDHIVMELTTGDQYEFNATVFANGGIKNVYLEYYFDQKPSQNRTMNRTQGNIYLGKYSLNITVPAHGLYLHYFISAVDLKGNWNNSPFKVRKIVDNDKPNIEDHTTLPPKTGDNFSFNISVSDNIEVSKVYLEFWLNFGSHQNVTLISQETLYQMDLTIPTNATNLSYIISAMDNSSNWVVQHCKILNITDIIKPTIIDYSGAPTTGDEYTFLFEFTDNILIKICTLEYWFDDRTHVNITLFEDEHKLKVPLDASILHSIVTVMDNSSNIQQMKSTRQITDNDPPVIYYEPNLKPETGRPFLINPLIFENKMIKNVSFEYWFDEDEHYLVKLILNNTNYNVKINISENAYFLHYILTVEDTQNNWAKIENELYIIDVLAPAISNLTNEIPTTGEEFIITAYVKDNIELKSIYLEYWFDQNEKANVTFINNYLIQIPIRAITLNYKLTAEDYSRNVQITEINLSVIDNDKPTIVDSSLRPTTGDEVKFEAEISDNVKVISATLEFWFNFGEHIKINFTKFGNTYTTLVSSNSTELHYTIIAVDGAKNQVYVQRDLSVIDNDPPLITDFSNLVEEDLNLLVDAEDNFKVSDVKVNYWYEDKIEYSVYLQFIDGLYRGKIDIQRNKYLIYYVIVANDTSGNENITQQKGLELPFTKKDSTSSQSERYNLFIIYLIIFILAMCTASGIIYLIKRKVRKQKPQIPTNIDTYKQETLLNSKSNNKSHSDLELDMSGRQMPISEDTSPIQNVQPKIEPTNGGKTTSTPTFTPSVSQKPIQPPLSNNQISQNQLEVHTSTHKQINEKELN